MTMEVLVAGVPVRELAPEAEWYGRLSGRAADTVPNDDVAELADRNIAVGPIAPVGESGRKATGEDPDGNSIDLVEVTR